MLIRAGISNKVDDSGVTVGKRYARTDECGIPFAITVDFDTLQDETVTLRELDSTKQIRLPIKDLALVVSDLTSGYTKWSDAVDKYGLFTGAVEMTEEEVAKKATEKPVIKEKKVSAEKEEQKAPKSKDKKAKDEPVPFEKALENSTWICGDMPSSADREAFEII